jgi:aminopeptidase N
MGTRPLAILKQTILCAVLAGLLLIVPHSASAQRLPTNVAPIHYSLALTPDLQSATFSGVESIDVTVKQPATTITLNAIELAFQSVTIAANGKEQTATVSLDPGKQQATFTFPSTIPGGRATLKIRYTGILNDKLSGFYISKTARRNYAVTQFEATDARRAFPCFDEPASKATFDVSLTIDAGDTAISNSPILSDTPGPDAGKHTLAFATTPKMSTYLLAFLVGDFQCTRGEQDGVELSVCSTPDKVALTPFALDIAKFTLHYYDNYFGIDYPLKKLDLIAVPDLDNGAMENFGAITFREELLLIDPKTASLPRQVEAAVDIAHEMAHQWFGDLVTMQWWDNVWLNEGFATWMSYKPVAAMHPEWEIPQLVASNEEDTLNVDSQPTTHAIRANAETPDQINQLFDRIAYYKASEVLLMVENYLGEDTFRKGIHAYLAAHAYGNATAEDFWNAQTAVSHKPVDKVMESLITQPGAPILTFAASSASRVSVTQSRFYLSPSITPNPAQKWTLPVCFKTGEGNPCDLLTPEKSRLALPMSPLLFANAGGKGYYRSAYAPAEYAALVANVETGLTPVERISLAGDEWAQVRANKAPVGNYLDLVAALRSDPNSQVLAPVFTQLSAIGDQVTSTNEERDALARWMRRNFAPEYAKLGPPAPGDSPNTRQLRGQLFGLLCSRGADPALLAQARQIADQFLDNPASVDPTLAQTALAVAARNGDATFFDKLQHVYETSGDPARQQSALQALVQFRDPALLERGLEYAVSSKVRNQDTAIVLATALQLPQNRDQAWQFIKSHWDQVRAQLTMDLASYLVAYTGRFCTTEARDDIRSFFAEHEVAGADAALRHTLEQIDGCIELRRLQEPNLKKWLAAQSGQ